jgi:hypothetical protein
LKWNTWSSLVAVAEVKFTAQVAVLVDTARPSQENRQVAAHPQKRQSSSQLEHTQSRSVAVATVELWEQAPSVLIRPSLARVSQRSPRQAAALAAPTVATAVTAVLVVVLVLLVRRATAQLVRVMTAA